MKRSIPASRMDDDRLRLTRELEHEIARNVRQCIKNIMSLANGVPKGMGIDDAYDRLPDRAANEYVINRVLGRPATKKLMADPPPSPEKRIDLSRVPQDRLDIMEKWLEEAESGEEAGGNYG